MTAGRRLPSPPWPHRTPTSPDHRSGSPTAPASTVTGWRQRPRWSRGGRIDALTGDWLAELTMLILARTQSKRPGGGYARTFVTPDGARDGPRPRPGHQGREQRRRPRPGRLCGRGGRGGGEARPQPHDRLRRWRRPAAPTRRARRRRCRADALRDGRAGGRRRPLHHRQRLPRLLGDRRRAEPRRRHRRHRTGHRRRGRLRAGRLASRLVPSRLGRARGGGRRRPRDRVRRPDDRRELLVLHRGVGHGARWLPMGRCGRRRVLGHR